MFGNWLRRFVVFSMMAAATQAAPSLTEIQDVLYKADGTLFEGLAQIEWKSFVAADGTVVPQNIVTLRVTRGNIRAALVPTTNALRAASYTVKFNSDGRSQFVEVWAVPPTTTILKLKDVRVGGAGNLTTPVINIQDVPGLRTELDLRPTRGAGWLPGRAAVIGLAGTLESVAGTGSDCVHVDGTSGPCGTSGGTTPTPAPTVTFVDSETPSGVQNGINANFTLSAAPSPASSLRLFRNGILLAQTLDYTVSGNLVTMLGTNTPKQNDIVQAWYRSSGTLVSIVDAETPAGTVNGLNATFTLASTPVPAASLQLYRNGILLKSGLDYNLTANSVTFVPVAVPRLGDVVQASYRK